MLKFSSNTVLKTATKTALLGIFLVILLGQTGCVSVSGALNGSPTFGHANGILDIPLKDLKKRYTNADSKFINLNGVDIHYQDSGEGDTIVLLHGMMSSLQSWDGWVTELEKSYRVIRLDIPGFGLTGAPASESKLGHRYMLQTFEQFVEQLQLEKFDLVGNSIGGLIAAGYAAKHSGKVSRLILLDPIAYPQDLPWIFYFATAPIIRLGAEYVQPPLLLTMNVANAYGDSDRLTDDNIERYVRMSMRPGAKVAYIHILDDIKELASSEDGFKVGTIPAPTLIMWGKEDSWTPIELSKLWLRDQLNATLKVYPEAGHMPNEELPEETVKDALLFLNDQPVDGVLSREEVAAGIMEKPLESVNESKDDKAEADQVTSESE